jgi:trehalose 6-phosphate synthase
MDIARPEVNAYTPLENALRAALGNRRLIMASNRGPLEYYTEANLLRARRGSGGVVTALAGISDHTRITWVASAMSDSDRMMAELSSKSRDGGAANLNLSLQVRFVVSPTETYVKYYNVVSNPTLWFLQHQMTDLLDNKPTEDELLHAWIEGYIPVNKAFASIIAQEAAPMQPSPIIMLHDYHLYLVPSYIRKMIPDAMVHHFIHIPWPAPDYWRLLPVSMRSAILSSLCSNDIIGFQTPWSRDQFLATCDEFLPSAEISFARAEIIYQERICRPRVYPIAIDCTRVINAAYSTAANHHTQKLMAPPSTRTIVRVDRMDPTKNIRVGFLAFAQMLEAHPELVGNVRFLAFLVPCRNGIPAYQRYSEEVLHLITEINQRFGYPGYQPVELYYQNDYEHALAGMRLYDVLLINPVQDGMNLVAKEGPLVNQRNGVVVLSREAGAFCELAEGVVPVAPLDINDTAERIYEALLMSEQERRSKAAFLRQQVQTHNIQAWLLRQFEDISMWQKTSTQKAILSRSRPTNSFSGLTPIMPPRLAQKTTKSIDHRRMLA